MKTKDIEAAMRAAGLTLETDGGGADAWHAVIGDTWHTRIVAEAYGSTRTQAKAKALAKYHALITQKPAATPNRHPRESGDPSSPPSKGDQGGYSREHLNEWTVTMHYVVAGTHAQAKHFAHAMGWTPREWRLLSTPQGVLTLPRGTEYYDVGTYTDEKMKILALLDERQCKPYTGWFHLCPECREARHPRESGDPSSPPSKGDQGGCSPC